MTEHDAELVALIDNELDADASTRLLARIAEDEALRKRYDALRDAGRLMATAFDALFEAAPLPRLRAYLPPEGGKRAARMPISWTSLRQLVAAIAALLLAAGVGAWIALTFAAFEKTGDWRSAVEEYTNLYTNETFTPLKPDASLEAIELAAVGSRVGVRLTPEAVALPGLRFTVAFMLSYKGSPLAAVACVDPAGEPVLLCIIANQGPEAPLLAERRGELSLGSWSRDGRGFLVIGRMSEERALALARTLEERI